MKTLFLLSFLFVSSQQHRDTTLVDTGKARVRVIHLTAPADSIHRSGDTIKVRVYPHDTLIR